MCSSLEKNSNYPKKTRNWKFMIKKKHGEMYVAFENCLDVLHTFLLKNGTVKVANCSTSSDKELAHDHMLFCLAKATRSLVSVDLLMKNSSFEDSLILTRSAYECYVNAGAVLNTPELVDQLIRVRLGKL